MIRAMRPAVLLVASVLVAVLGLLFVGGQVAGCLGPLGVTPVQCTAVHLAADPDFSVGPGPELPWVMGAAMGLAVAAVLPWGRLDRRSAVLIVAAAVLGAIVGVALYELTWERTLTGPTSTGEVITVTLNPNDAARALNAVLGAGLGAIGAGLALRFRRSSNASGSDGGTRARSWPQSAPDT